MPSLSKKRRELLSRFQQPSEDDPHPSKSGVLLSDEIQFYAEHHHLIHPFERENLKPAAYELTLGDEYFLNGEYRSLGLQRDNDTVKIPPFEVAVLKTAEILCLPRYIIGRWNIKVRHAYSGLLWVGGPQVDPGWVGHLFCPIYNLSDKPVTLHIGDQIAVIDFVKTTPFDKAKSQNELLRYRYPPTRNIVQDFQIDDLRSALFTTAAQKLKEFEEAITTMTTRFTIFTQISFAVFALVISLLAIVSKVNADNLVLGTAVWGGMILMISIFAVLVVLFSNVPWRVGPLVYELYGRVMGDRAEDAMRFLRRRWWVGLVTSIVLAIAGAYGGYTILEPYFRDLRQQQLLTKSDLVPLEASLNIDLRHLSERLTRLEGTRYATVDDLETLKTTVEQSIQSVRSTTNK